MSWRPISEAPMHKDVLVWVDAGCGPLLARCTHAMDFLFTTEENERKPEDQQWSEVDYFELCWWSYCPLGAVRMSDDTGDPTHWMPLPPPPEAGAEG